MSYPQPFYRMWRGGQVYSYILDNRYSEDRIALCRAFKIIEKDLGTLFDYIEPADDNINTYSHRSYELLLRACTEFETNCKGILQDNGYINQKEWNISDYNKLNDAMHLSDYSVIIPIWKCTKDTIALNTHAGTFKLIKPFNEWGEDKPLSWYKSYNDVKHNREYEFRKASLNNVLNAIAGLAVILYAQFEMLIFSIHEFPIIVNGIDGYIGLNDALLCIKAPKWNDDEKYVFDWPSLKTEKEPYIKYPFK